MGYRLVTNHLHIIRHSDIELAPLAVTFAALRFYLLQRRCYWLLDSEDDIVLVHYLNIAQRQQPSKSCSHMLNEDAISQRRSEDKGSSSPSDQDMSATSDPDYAPTLGMPETAAQMKHSSALETEAANSQDMPTVTSEACMPFLPSMSMEGFFAGIDGKPSNDKLGLEGPLRSNIAVQELLQSWEEEQNVEPSLLQRAQGSWQVRHACVSDHYVITRKACMPYRLTETS